MTERVSFEAGRAAGVEARVGDHRLIVRARCVVVAGGALHSPALLCRSGIRLPALGRFLALHPATAIFALLPEEIRPWTGTLQAHYSGQFADLDRGFGFKFETAPLHRWISCRPGESTRAHWLAAIDGAGLGPNQLLLASYHQMASCRMGSSPRTSVVNAENQVWGVPGLYVADASVFPSASGVNPMLTIMGIAHRAAQIIKGV